MYVCKRYKPGSSRSTLKTLLLSWKHGPAYPTPNCYNLTVFFQTPWREIQHSQKHYLKPSFLPRPLSSHAQSLCPLPSSSLCLLWPSHFLFFFLGLPLSSSLCRSVSLPISWILNHKTCLITCRPHDTTHVCDFTH